MSRTILRRRLLHVFFAAFIGALLLTAAANATPHKTWNLTKAFAVHKNKNPVRTNKDPDLWSWMYGEADTPSSYALMTDYLSPKIISKACSIKRFYQWDKLPIPSGTPTIFYNAGATVEEGHNPCAPFATYPTKTVFMHPEAGGNLYAVVAWRSPITGVVTVSGSVQCTDSHVSGIVWELDQGSTILLGPTEKADDGLTTFSLTALPVTAGQSLYFEIGPKPGSGGTFDTTAVTLNITS